jgi:hypothetical protein
VREAVAETLADNARYQEQAWRLLEGQGESDVTPARALAFLRDVRLIRA